MNNITPFDRHYFELLWEMSLKEFTTRYKQAVFGFIWIILNPLLQMLIMGVVFSNFITIPHYFTFLFSGLLPWQFFSQTITKTTTSYINERSLLQKTKFNKEIIVLSQVISNSINYFLSLCLFVVVLLFQSPSPNFNPFLLILASIWLIIFTTGFSLLTSSLNVRYRDVAFIVQMLSLIWFYATPIIYSFNQLPPHLIRLLVFNPLVTPIVLIQSNLVGQLLPPLNIIIGNLTLTFIVFILGLYTYKKESPYFVDWL